MSGNTASDGSLIGQIVTHYRVLEKLGSGGMGVVYKAEDTHLGRFVALKFLPDAIARDPHLLSRFRTEAKAASALNHPNICVIHDIVEENGHAFIVMEFLEGMPLSERIDGKPLDLDETLALGIEIADALDAAHAEGIVHRDIKPANIFVNKRGHAKLLDFGLAKVTPSEGVHAATADVFSGATRDTNVQRETGPGTMVGTVLYMSPEQIRGKEVDARTDLFSLGAVLYEMVTGVSPFQGKTPGVIFTAILDGAPTPAVRLNPEVPGELERIINKCLEKDRELRYQHASDIRSDLQGLRRHGESGTTPAIARPGIRSRVLRVLSFATAILILVAGLLGWHFLRPHTSNAMSIHSIAVLPFANASKNPEMDYLGEGLSEEITNSLSGVPNLQVMARSTLARFKSRQDDAQGVGRDLHVDAVLTGSIAAHENEVALETELVDVVTGAQLWGKRYTLPTTDISVLQSEITGDLASRLRPQLSGNEQQRLAKVGTRSADAYQLYLKGRFQADKATAVGLKESLNYYQQAIEKDPGYALAYAGIAEAYDELGSGSIYEPPKETLPKAEAAARKALALDDTLAEAHATLAYAEWFYNWDWPSAERDFRQAIQLNPNSSTAHRLYAKCLQTRGRFTESLDEVRRASVLDPLSPQTVGQLGYLYLTMGRYDDAIRELQKALNLYPNAPAHRIGLAWAYALKRNYSQALAQYDYIAEQDKAVTADNQLVVAELGWIYAMSGRQGEARKIAIELERLSSRVYVDFYAVAQIYAGLGENDLAFESLQRAYEERSGNMPFLATDPFWYGMRSDVRFTKLLDRVGFPPETH